MNLSITNLRISDNSYGYYKIHWVLNNKNCGVFEVFISDGYAMILNYNKVIDTPDGYGYEFIKQSINLLLKNKLNIISRNFGRSIISNKIWDKLEKEYSVNNILYKNVSSKII